MLPDRSIRVCSGHPSTFVDAGISYTPKPVQLPKP
jgi:hypothetical protein